MRILILLSTRSNSLNQCVNFEPSLYVIAIKEYDWACRVIHYSHHFTIISVISFSFQEILIHCQPISIHFCPLLCISFGALFLDGRSLKVKMTVCHYSQFIIIVFLFWNRSILIVLLNILLLFMHNIHTVFLTLIHRPSKNNATKEMHRIEQKWTEMDENG